MKLASMTRLFAFLSVAVLVAAISAAMPHDAHALGIGGGALAAMGTSVVPGNNPFAGLIPDELLNRQKRAFIAPLDWTPIGAGLAANMPLVADANHDFLIYRIAYVARAVADGAIVASPPLLVDISLRSGVQFTPQNFPVDLDNIGGSGRMAPDLAIPIVIPAGETLDVMLRSAAAVNLNVRIALIGFRTARAVR